MATKAEMVKAAVLAGFGTEAQLSKTFTNWQELGLLGKQEKKAPRRGGEGRWHPNQHQLWLWLLHNRAEGVRLLTLVNAPVGLWLLAAEGIQVEQARRAFAFWAKRMMELPEGADSLRRRAINEQVEKLAGAPRDPRSERRLRRGIQLLADDAITKETFTSEVLDVIAPAAEAREAHRWFAQSTYRMLSTRFRALAYMDVLTRDTADVLALWEWAGRMTRSSWSDYQQTWKLMHADPHIGRLFERPELAGFLNSACPTLLSVFGIGIERQNIAKPSPHREEPPKVKGLSEA